MNNKGITNGVVAKYSVLAKLHEKYIKQNQKKMVKIKMKKLVGSRKLELHIKKKNSGFVMQ